LSSDEWAKKKELHSRKKDRQYASLRKNHQIPTK
jgi:hypothetical protein